MSKVILTQSKEIWKDIEGYKGVFQISNLGNLRSKTRVIYDKNGLPRRIKGQLIKSSTSTHGYKVVVLRKDGKKKNFRVHRLVAKAFIENKEGKPYINHVDGNKINNSVENLEWCTNSENMKHAFNLGLKTSSNPNKNKKMQGSKHPKSKLTESDVLFIRINAKKKGGNMKNVDLADKFNVTKQTIGYIVNNETWTHVGGGSNNG